MKLRSLLFALLALPLAFAACEPTPDVDDPAKSELTLTSEATLEFGAQGGEAEISYTLTNAVEGVELTATCDADWVEVVASAKVRVTVAKNEGDAREATINVAYGEESFEVLVKQAAKPAKEYLFDEELAYAERLSLAEYGFPDNYFLIGFYNEAGNILLGAVLVGQEGESILQAGTYTAANGGLLIEGFELYVGETEEYFFEGGDGTVVVGGDIDGYTFDIELTDADAQNFHFTYEGVVENMKLGGDLPTEDVVFEAIYCEGEYYGTEYSDTYNYYLLLSDLGSDEDGYAMAGGTYYQVDLYSVEGEVDAEGYIHVPAGTYTFDVDDSTAEWTMGNYYSGYAKVSADGTAYDAKSAFQSGKAVVTENSITLEVMIGGVKHTVTYNGEPKIYVGGVTPPTPGEGVEFTANYAYAVYYGDMYTPGTADNYYFFLSDLGVDEDGYDYAGGTYYRFDIYAPITADRTITPGTYPIDVNDSMDPGTVGAYYSAYYKWNSYGDDYEVTDWPDDGFITFNEDGSIYAEVHYMVCGQTHKISFAGGDIVIYDGTEGGEGGEGGEGDILSTLTGDWNCNLSAHTLYYEGYGDWYEVGYQNWLIAIMPNSQEGDFVQFDLLAGADSFTSFAGEYTISNSLGAYTAYPGYIDYDYLAGAWYYKEDGVTMAPFVDGWVDVVDNGDGTYTVEFDVWDDADYNITGSWTGEIAPASELQSVTRSSSMKQLKSVVVNESAPVAKQRIESMSRKANRAAAPAKGLKLR